MIGLGAAGFSVAILTGGCPSTAPDNNNNFNSNNTGDDSGDNGSFDTDTTPQLSTANALSFTGSVGGTDTVDLYSIGTVGPGDHLVVDVRGTSLDPNGDPTLDAVAAIFD